MKIWDRLKELYPSRFPPVKSYLASDTSHALCTHSHTEGFTLYKMTVSRLDLQACNDGYGPAFEFTQPKSIFMTVFANCLQSRDYDFVAPSRNHTTHSDRQDMLGRTVIRPFDASTELVP